VYYLIHRNDKDAGTEPNQLTASVEGQP
jgi:hypothetical protein